MIRQIVLTVGCLALFSCAAWAAPTTELEISGGYTSQGITAVGTQLRTFGEARPGLRFYAEAGGSGYSGPRTDAFAGAFHYGGGLTPGAAYLEQEFSTGRLTSGVRVGRYRTPFGIYARSEHAYNGFLRPPLVRYGDDAGISNYWKEAGVDAFVGTPHLQLETSLGTPEDGDSLRQSGLDAVVRLQGYHGPCVFGASYMRTQTTIPLRGGRGNAWYTGADARWMKNGVQFRGEWISGQPFPNGHMDGWYVDALVHRPGLGPVTPVLRYEEYRYNRPFDHGTERRWTTGARINITPSLVAHLNYLRQSGVEEGGKQAVDVGLTRTFRF